MSKLTNTHGIAHVYLDGDCDEGIEGYFNLFADGVRHKSRPAHLADRIVIEKPGPRVQYLVTISCSMDDVPVRLFDTEDEVRDYCRANPRPAGTDETKDHDWLGRDFSCVNGYDVVKFEGGKPVAHVNLWGDPGEGFPDELLTEEGADAIANLTDGPIFPEKAAGPLKLFVFNTDRSQYKPGVLFLDVAVIAAADREAALATYRVGDAADSDWTPDITIPKTSDLSYLDCVGTAEPGTLPGFVLWASYDIACDAR